MTEACNFKPDTYPYIWLKIIVLKVQLINRAKNIEK